MNIYTITSAEAIFLTIINPSENKDTRLGPKHIVGRLKNHSLPPSPDNILINPTFLEHFHKTILFFSQFSDQVIQLTEKNKAGFVYIMDHRNGKSDPPKQEDIIGSFEVQHGTVVSASYLPNPDYQLISKDGAFMLQPELEALLLATAN